MLKHANVDEKRIKHVEAIVLSMTKAERKDPDLLNGSRRARIARGSGRTVQEVNTLIKQFEQMKQLMKGAGKRGKGLPLGGMPFRPR
jgi:signal recognition particle subunit SRP54